MKEVKTHEIDGVTYVEVDRNAKVGDMVWLVNIRDSIKLSEVNNIDGINEDIEHGWVKTLEPTVDTSQASPQVIDMLANLARRVTSLESQLSDTQRNAEMLAEELMALKYLTQSNEGDIRELDSRTQVLGAINKYYAEGSR